MFLFWNRHSLLPKYATQNTRKRLGDDFVDKLDSLHREALNTGLINRIDLQEAWKKKLKSNERNEEANGTNILYIFFIITFVMIATPIFYKTISSILGVRCFVPNNFLVSEATRPISDCRFCKGIKGPLILSNLTRDEFTPYAYSSQPIIIKNAISHWAAIKNLNYTFLKSLYESIPNVWKEKCQFMKFRSDFTNLHEVFQMPEERVTLEIGQTPWYVGWSNCHPLVLEELRKLYPRPHFLPRDAEMAKTDFIYMGYEQGVEMHLDYIPRLLWQAQIQGNKSWILAPIPECDSLCSSFSFYVEPGDALLIDTRTWYHGISHPQGHFTLTIQSEYG